MSGDVRIEVTCDCPKCGGERTIYDDRYHEFAAFEAEWEIANPRPRPRVELQPPEAADLQWAREREAAAKQWWAERGFPGGRSQWPPEEYPCDACAGSGRVRRALSVEEFRRLLVSGPYYLPVGERRENHG